MTNNELLNLDFPGEITQALAAALQRLKTGEADLGKPLHKGRVSCDDLLQIIELAPGVIINPAQLRKKAQEAWLSWDELALGLRLTA